MKKILSVVIPLLLIGVLFAVNEVREERSVGYSSPVVSLSSHTVTQIWAHDSYRLRATFYNDTGKDIWISSYTTASLEHIRINNCPVPDGGIINEKTIRKMYGIVGGTETAVTPKIWLWRRR